MKKLAYIVVLALLAAACSSSSDPDVEAVSATSATSVDSSSESPSSTAAGASTTTDSAATTSTAAVGSDVSSCVVGDWEMDSQQFFDDIYASGLAGDIPGEFVHAGGEYVLLIGADGSFSSERREWSFSVSTEAGDLEMQISGAESGTYTLDGNALTTTLASTEPLDVSMIVDGVPFEFPEGLAPITPPNAQFEGAFVACDGDILTASAEGFQSIWYRTG